MPANNRISRKTKNINSGSRIWRKGWYFNVFPTEIKPGGLGKIFGLGALLCDNASRWPAYLYDMFTRSVIPPL